MWQDTRGGADWSYRSVPVSVDRVKYAYLLMTRNRLRRGSAAERTFRDRDRQGSRRNLWRDRAAS